MSGVIVNGVKYDIEGLVCRSWYDDPKLRLKMGEDGTRRATQWVRGIVLHTTRGIPGGSDRRPQQIRPGYGPNRNTAQNVNHWWSTNYQSAGAHIVVDFDGTVSCLADLQAEITYHATSVNQFTIGIEIAQGSEAELWQGQLHSVVRLVDWLTLHFGIQRQIPDFYRGAVSRLRSGGQDVVGVYGHRDQTFNRGIGDPGDAVFEYLDRGGYERMNFVQSADLETWKSRQMKLHVKADGIPGPKTVQAIREFQKANELPVTGLLDAVSRVQLGRS